MVTSLVSASTLNCAGRVAPSATIVMAAGTRPSRSTTRSTLFSACIVPATRTFASTFPSSVTRISANSPRSYPYPSRASWNTRPLARPSPSAMTRSVKGSRAICEAERRSRVCSGTTEPARCSTGIKSSGAFSETVFPPSTTCLSWMLCHVPRGRYTLDEIPAISPPDRRNARRHHRHHKHGGSEEERVIDGINRGILGELE